MIPIEIISTASYEIHSGYGSGFHSTFLLKEKRYVYNFNYHVSYLNYFIWKDPYRQHGDYYYHIEYIVEKNDFGECRRTFTFD